MSIPPLPEGLKKTALNGLANDMHSLSIHLLRRARMADRKSQLSPERLSVLSVLNFAGPLPITKLAELESVSAPAISRMVAALENEGFATKKRSDADSRIVEATITKKGARLVETIRRTRITNIANEIALLSPSNRQKLTAIAEIMAELFASSAP